MVEERDLLPLSAIQHFAFCPRQCALIHIEGQWAENRFTVEGRLMHDRVHDGSSETRGDIRYERGLLLVSRKLGLVGMADMVEFHKKRDPSGKIFWRPFPVEYKRGRSKREDWDRMQLCAQAICLEEMLNLDIPSGALFYGKTRRREDVIFEKSLRQETEAFSRKLHVFIEKGDTPPAVYSKKCERCSLKGICIPGLSVKKSVNQYLNEMRHS